MPAVFRVSLRATSTYSTNIVGVQQSFAVGCNTPFQPFRTVTTSIVPQYMAFLGTAYDRVYVERAYIRVEVVNSTMPDAVYVVLSYDGNTTASTDINELADARYAQSHTLGYYSGGDTHTAFTAEFTPERLLGIPASSSENVCLGGDPIDPMFWVLSIKPAAATTGNVAFKINVVYDLVFSELKMPAP